MPAEVAIGVTGHRKIPRSGLIINRAGDAIQWIMELLPPLKHTPIVLTVLSSLAEGADRLLAEKILKIPHSRLKAVLPLECEDYRRDFKQPGSWGEFRRLLDKAEDIKIMPWVPGRNEAYRQAGRYIVDHCDILIALWNGKKSRGIGGTGDIVQYARARKRPLLWIRPDSRGGIELEPGRGLSRESFLELDRRNSGSVLFGKSGGQPA